VDVGRLPGIRRLAVDYARDFAGLAQFFAGNPAEPAAWAAAIARGAAHDYPRRQIAGLVRQQLLARGAPAPARAAAELLGEPRAVAIVTGQQAGLFGGPLFTLLKAITALKLADEVARTHGVPAVTIFWIDAEDHDWDEVRTCTVLDEELAPRTVALPPRDAREPLPVAAVRLDEAVAEAVHELETVLPRTEFRPGLVEQLREVYVPGRGMAEAFACWLDRVMGDRGLVVFDASDPGAKPLAAGVFTRELQQTGTTARLAASAGASLAARGYHAQVQTQDHQVALFHQDPVRQPIRAIDGRFLVGGREIESDALFREAAERPAVFSPSVLLRPIVQDTLFPTLACVAGPNELAYFAQLRSVYDHFDRPMPLIYPRATATLLDAAALRFLEKYQLPLEALQPQDEAALNRLLKDQIPREVEASLADAEAGIARHLAGVIQAVPAVDPTLRGAAESTLGRMQHDLASLRAKIVQAAKRRDVTMRRQFNRTRALAFPNGEPQERAVGLVWFLNQYGPALVDRLMAALPLDIGRHWIISI
jgi:bacillithiol biosynthesis cysteine-adding enzyme BshC